MTECTVAGVERKVQRQHDPDKGKEDVLEVRHRPPRIMEDYIIERFAVEVPNDTFL